MDKVVQQMQTPAPKHVVDGLCSRLREIAAVEQDHGESLANECRSFIYQQGEVKWVDVLITAYLINGGVMLREPIAPAATTKKASPERTTAKIRPVATPDSATTMSTSVTPLSSAAPRIAAPQCTVAPVVVDSPVVVKSPNRAKVDDFLESDMIEIENMVINLGLPE